MVSITAALDADQARLTRSVLDLPVKRQMEIVRAIAAAASWTPSADHLLIGANMIDADMRDDEAEGSWPETGAWGQSPSQGIGR